MALRIIKSGVVGVWFFFRYFFFFFFMMPQVAQYVFFCFVFFLNLPASEDVSYFWCALQGVSNEADGFNNSLQLDCDFTMWMGLRDALITEHDKVLEHKRCGLWKRAVRFLTSM